MRSGFAAELVRASDLGTLTGFLRRSLGPTDMPSRSGVLRGGAVTDNGTAGVSVSGLWDTNSAKTDA